MKKGLSKLLVQVAKKNIQKETDRACLCIGYQPTMPESAKKFKRKKK